MNCNFGGLCLGNNGEEIDLIRIDDITFQEPIGFVHADLQGAESFAFCHGKEFLRTNRPVIFYENNKLHNNELYQHMCAKYPEYKDECVFDLKEFCLRELHYREAIENFHGTIDTLLIP